jgi:hypothetical protein
LIKCVIIEYIITDIINTGGNIMKRLFYCFLLLFIVVFVGCENTLMDPILQNGVLNYNVKLESTNLIENAKIIAIFENG